MSIIPINKQPLGLDISDLSIKAVRLKQRGANIFLQNYNEVEVPANYIIAGEIKKENEVIKLINKLLGGINSRGLKTKEIISVLPETKTFLKSVELPDGKNNLGEVVAREIVHHIPWALEEIYFDWQILNHPAEKDGNVTVLIGACPKKIVDQYTNLLLRAGLIPLALEIEGIAIGRALTNYRAAEEEKINKIIIDFGATRTGLVLYRRNLPLFSLSLPISGSEITSTIAEKLDLGVKQAEKIKIACGLDKKKCRGALKTILHDKMDQLVAEIEKAIFFYENHFENPEKIQKIILAGGGSNFLSIDKFLSEKLRLPVEIGNPLINLGANRPTASIPKAKIPSYTTAIGLALRRITTKDPIL